MTLSVFDRIFGGEALAGKKTMLAVIAYVVLAILQAVGIIGAATPTGQILTVLTMAFGAQSAADRIVQALGVIAARPKQNPNVMYPPRRGRFTASVRCNSDPAGDRLLTGSEVVRDASTGRFGRSVKAARKTYHAVVRRCG